MKFNWRKFGKNILKTIGLALFGGVCLIAGGIGGVASGAWAEAQHESSNAAEVPSLTLGVLNRWHDWVMAGEGGNDNA